MESMTIDEEPGVKELVTDPKCRLKPRGNEVIDEMEMYSSIQ